MKHTKALITERRTTPISNVVLSLKDARDLASVIWEEHEKDPLFSSVRFVVNCSGNYLYESEDIVILDDDSVITRRKVDKIQINYQSGKEKAITLELKHGNDDEDNFIDVSGNDNMWVNGINGKFDERMKLFKPQQPLLLKHQARIRWFSFIAFSISFGFVVDMLSQGEENYTRYWIYAYNDPWGYGIGYLFVAMIMGALFGLPSIQYFIEKAENLWPSVELQIGPEHLQVEKQKRSTGLLWFSVFILPVILFVLSLIFSS
jgi:hypothetical protein